MNPTKWTCPHCNKEQIATDDNYHSIWNLIYVGETALGPVGLFVVAVGCLNDDCRLVTLTASLDRVATHDRRGPTLETWRLMPESSALPQPDFIPLPIRNDYFEACRIRTLSPKASATLARRCLQGMIRDFAGIVKGTLDAEIKDLKKRIDDGNAPAGVTHESAEAIDHVRSIGNIGAHMERDINLIIDVDPGEAEALTDLIELLFNEWYVARNDRQQRLKRLAAIAEEKKLAIAEGRAALAQEDGGPVG